MEGTTAKKFKDSEFPADSTSIYGPDSHEAIDRSEIKWLRPNKLKYEHDHGLLTEKGQSQGNITADNRWTVMTREDVNPKDIIQGHLGNCWFICALALVAQKPERIEKIILTKEVNPAGVYVIRLCKDGLWHDVVVDDRLPCCTDGQLKYARSRRKQLWVSLIEKAMAKLHGSYEALQAGQSHEGLIALTGYSSYSMELKFEDEPNDGLTATKKLNSAWQVLLLCRKGGFLIGASCGKPNDSENEKAYTEVGLEYNHAYSVLDVCVIARFRLLQLRNPWGTSSFNGDWSIKSACWTPELLSKLKRSPDKEDDGVFWISFDDVIRYFKYIDICQLRNNWLDQRFASKFPKSSSSTAIGYCIDVLESTEVEIALHQKSVRSAAKKDDKTNGDGKIDICMVIFNISKSQYELDGTVKIKKVSGCSRRVAETSTAASFSDGNGILKPGAYLVLPFSFQNYLDDEIAEDFALSIHSSKPLLVNELPLLPKIFLSEALICFTIEKGTKIKMEDKHIAIHRKTHVFAGISIVVENFYKDKWVHNKADFQGQGRTNTMSTRESLEVYDVIPPQHRQLILILTCGDTSKLNEIQPEYRVSSEQYLEDWAPKGKVAEKLSHYPRLISQPPEDDIHCPRAIK